MPRINQIKLLVALLFVFGGAGLLFTNNAANPHAEAFSSGPPAGFTKAPGELDCSECHLVAEPGTGRLNINAPQVYTPGRTYQITVSHSNADQTRTRWGFQLTALDAADERAGTLAPLDSLTRVLLGEGAFPTRQYVEHTSQGTFSGQRDGASWTFNWTAPTNDVGPVSFYVAGNQANGDENSSGDHIYFTFATAVFAPPAANPIDETEFFVRQQYRDFLSREPDAGGLAFWTGGVESCGTDAQCRQVKRIDTSAAFFLSIEFQETGFLVQRIYKAAFMNLPGTPFPLTLGEFTADSQRIAGGVQVGVGDWAAQLESNKNAFTREFVGRQRFLDAYPLLMTSAQFVEKLDANAGRVLSAEERAQLIAMLDGAADINEARSRVLRRVAEDADLVRLEFNRAFVQMQYFGYLRRDPDIPGYNFWLGKLDQFNGDFRQAQMVQAFLESIEYRERFTQP